MTAPSLPSSGSWQNWSGSVKASPAQILRPTDSSDIVSFLKTSTGRVRVVGTGHSFTPLAVTEDTLLSLEGISGGVLDHDPATLEARLQAGATLHALSRDLHDCGLAFKNLGDIDGQSLAGATATATHGTGKTFPCLSAEIQGLSLITATGERVCADAQNNTDLLRSGQVSLGALGVIEEATVAVRPAFKLHRHTYMKPLKETLTDAMSLWERHRNYEFFCIAFCDHALNVTHDETDADLAPGEPNDDDASVRDLKNLRDWLGWSRFLRRRLINAVARRVKPEDMIDQSWRLLARERNVKFNEMEYHLPVETGLDALSEIIDTVERDCPDVFFPIECRMTAGDAAWLSPFQGGPRISVAVHAYAGDSYDWFFHVAEPIFRRHGGRPHWGKMHSLEADDLRALYPDFEKFLALRRELDPAGRFLNPYLANLWGVPFDA